MPKPVKVFVAVLTISETVHMSIAEFLADAQRQNYLSKAVKFSSGIFNGISGYANARNTVAQYFLDKTDYEWLWFIDDDIVLPRNALDLLQVGEADIIAALMPTIKTVIHNIDEETEKRKMNVSIPFCLSRFEDLDDLDSITYIDVEKESGIVEVDVVGMGCTLIHRSVLEDRRMVCSPEYARPDGKVAVLTDEEPKVRFQYHTRPNGRLIMGEDYNFCWRARKLGYKVKANLDVFCGHLKNMDLAKMFDIQHFAAMVARDHELLKEQQRSSAA